MAYWLQKMSRPETEEAVRNAHGAAIVPVGSVEQHSLDLPPGTDSYVSITLADTAS